MFRFWEAMALFLGSDVFHAFIPELKPHHYPRIRPSLPRSGTWQVETSELKECAEPCSNSRIEALINLLQCNPSCFWYEQEGQNPNDRGDPSITVFYGIFAFGATFWTPYMLGAAYGDMGPNVGYFYAGGYEQEGQNPNDRGDPSIEIAHIGTHVPVGRA
jgi:hypothetical protein